MVTWRGSLEGFVTPAVREIYLRYARGGAGMLVLEATGVRDVPSGPLLRLSHDRYVPGLRALVRELREHTDALIVPQIIDFLKIARRRPTRRYLVDSVRQGSLPAQVLALDDAQFEAELPRFLPSARAQRDFLHGYRQTIEDLDHAEIRRIPGFFADAARRARTAGFDGVELHFAHAYTLASFLSTSNARQDEYGGSLTNRLRLPLEVLAAVRAAVGYDFVVGCRYLGSEDVRQPDGTITGTTLDEACLVGVELARAGLDFLSVSRGGRFEDALQPPVGEAAYPYTGHSGHVCIPRRRGDPAGANVFQAAAVRAALHAAGLAHVPVVTAGRIGTRALAESILQAGHADLIGMARALLADPDLPRKWRAEQDHAVRACVFCPYCEHEDQHHRTVTCTLWPKAPGDHRRRLTPSVWDPEQPGSDRGVFEVPAEPKG